MGLPSSTKGLLWLIAQHIRSQNRGRRPVRYNLLHNDREWRLQYFAFRPALSDCPTTPFVLLACFIPHRDTVTCVFRLCDWSDNEKVFRHCRGSLNGAVTPPPISESKMNRSTDTMKWNLLRHLPLDGNRQKKFGKLKKKKKNYFTCRCDGRKRDDFGNIRWRSLPITNKCNALKPNS